ncbi:hypothetical protein B0H13DRAFT_2545760, partial [Mycena leptocephala]
RVRIALACARTASPWRRRDAVLQRDAIGCHVPLTSPPAIVFAGGDGTGGSSLRGCDIRSLLAASRYRTPCLQSPSSSLPAVVFAGGDATGGSSLPYLSAAGVTFVRLPSLPHIAPLRSPRPWLSVYGFWTVDVDVGRGGVAALSAAGVTMDPDSLSAREARRVIEGSVFSLPTYRSWVGMWRCALCAVAVDGVRLGNGRIPGRNAVWDRDNG